MYHMLYVAFSASFIRKTALMDEQSEPSDQVFAVPARFLEFFLFTKKPTYVKQKIIFVF
jgi:hypothetical protein